MYDRWYIFCYCTVYVVLVEFVWRELMGDQADYLIEQGLEALIAHRTGQCKIDWCEYCLEEWEEAHKGEK